jgi:hypothetical protein
MRVKLHGESAITNEMLEEIEKTMQEEVVIALDNPDAVVVTAEGTSRMVALCQIYNQLEDQQDVRLLIMVPDIVGHYVRDTTVLTEMAPLNGGRPLIRKPSRRAA